MAIKWAYLVALRQNQICESLFQLCRAINLFNCYPIFIKVVYNISIKIYQFTQEAFYTGQFALCPGRILNTMLGYWIYR